MSTGDVTKTKCDDRNMYQRGQGNLEIDTTAAVPQIIQKDVIARK
jgi:hypothetical protein